MLLRKPLINSELIAFNWTIKYAILLLCVSAFFADAAIAQFERKRKGNNEHDFRSDRGKVQVHSSLLFLLFSSVFMLVRINVSTDHLKFSWLQFLRTRRFALNFFVSKLNSDICTTSAQFILPAIKFMWMNGKRGCGIGR